MAQTFNWAKSRENQINIRKKNSWLPMHQLVSQRRMHRQWGHQMPVPKRPIQQIKAPQMSIRPTQRSKPMPKGPMHHIKTPPMSEGLVQCKVNIKVTQSNHKFKSWKTFNTDPLYNRGAIGSRRHPHRVCCVAAVKNNSKKNNYRTIESQ